MSTVSIKEDPESSAAFQALVQQRRDENSKARHIGEIVSTADGVLAPSSVASGKKIEKDLELGLYEDIPEEERKKALELAHENLKKWDTWNQEVNLEKDLLTVPGQNFAVICWIGPSFKAKSFLYGYRIMGAFPDLTSAQEYAHKVNQHDPMYDCGVIEMNLWCYNYPDESDGLDENGNQLSTDEAQKKYDESLNKFIVNHKIEREESKQLFEARKAILARNKAEKESEMPEDLKKEIEHVKFTGRPTEKLKILHERETKKWADKPALNPTHEHLKEIVRKREEIEQREKNGVTGAIGVTGATEPVKLDLTPSNLKVHGQEYAAVSYVGHTGTNQRIPLCVKGVYDSKESCEESIKKMVQMDDTFDILPAPLYCWLPCDPDIGKMKQIYTDDRLNELTEGAQNESQEALRFHSVVKTNKEEVLAQPLDPNYKGKGVDAWNPVVSDAATSTASYVFNSAEEGNIPTWSFQGKAGEASENMKNVWQGNIEIEEIDEISEEMNKTAKAENTKYQSVQFENLEENIKDFEKRFQELLIQGHSEEEARKMLRVSEEREIEYSTPSAEDLEKIEKPKADFKTIKELMKDQQEIIKSMKESGATPKEIREFLAKK